MDDRLQRLADKAKTLPKTPGVYLMKDDKGRVIYVGKSASLRDRVGSYFQPSAKLEFKKAPLRDCVVDFECIETDTEVEALLAENRLIKDIQPKFNARLLDDKTFPYLMVTTGDDYPGVYVTREPRTSGVKLYGPFTSVYQLKEAVTHLQKAFKFRTCHLDIRQDDSSKRFFRPCLLYAIKQCTAPCVFRRRRSCDAGERSGWREASTGRCRRARPTGTLWPRRRCRGVPPLGWFRTLSEGGRGAGQNGAHRKARLVRGIRKA